MKSHHLHILLLGVFCISRNTNGEIFNKEETCLTDGTCTESFSNGSDDAQVYQGDFEDDDDEEQDYGDYFGGFWDDEDDYDEEEDEEAEGEAQECIDESEHCTSWANQGECESNPAYMLVSCRVSCNTCPLTYGITQDTHVDGEENVSNLKRVVADMVDYMENKVMVEEKYEEYREHCKNHDEKCAYWKYTGECEKNRKWMNTNCAPVCQTCDELIICPKEPFSENIWGPGDLNKMFEKITTDEQFQKYKPQIISRPAIEQLDATEINNDSNHINEEESSVNKKEAAKELQNDRSDQTPPMNGPWVVVLEEFVSKEECEALIEVGGNLGYARSTVDSNDSVDGTYEKSEADYRTSSNTWCDSTCNENELTNNVIKKIEELTGIPELYSEYLQLLHYQEGQFYVEHHDYLDHQMNALEGPRLLTVFLYLNDVEDGGGTKFNHLNTTVTPKRGRAVIWPSVLDEDPLQKEPLTNHEALPVIKGEKYGANAWVHLRDTRSGLDMGC